MADVDDLTRGAVRTVLHRYCEAVDRRDWDAVCDCYWPEATDHHGVYVGDAAGLARHFAGALHVFRSTVHMVSEPELGFVDEGRVASAARVLAFHWGVAGTPDLVMGATYRDVFERRGDKWRIISRVVEAVDASEHQSTGERWAYLDRFQRSEEPRRADRA